MNLASNILAQSNGTNVDNEGLQRLKVFRFLLN